MSVLIVALLLFFLASFRIIKEKEARLKIEIHKILRQGLPYVLTGLSLVIATTYYFSPLALQNQNWIKIPRPLFNLIVKPMIGTIEKQFSSPEVINQFEIQFGILIEEENLESALYQAVNQEINRVLQNYQSYLPLGLAIGIFIILRTLAVPFMWLAILLSWIVFRILVSIKAIKIHEKAVLKQVIEV